MAELRDVSASQASSVQPQPGNASLVRQRTKPVAPVLVAPLNASLTPAIAHLIKGSYDYIPGTTLPTEGWFQGCRGCRRRTSYMMRNRTLQEVPACRSCADDVFRQHPDICALNLPGVCSIPTQGQPSEMNQIAMAVMSEHKAAALRRQIAAQQATAGQCPTAAARSLHGASSCSRELPMRQELPTQQILYSSQTMVAGQEHAAPAAAAAVVRVPAQAAGSKAIPTAMTSVFQTACLSQPAPADLNTPPPQHHEHHPNLLPSRLSATSATGQAMDCASAAPELKQAEPACVPMMMHSSSGHSSRRTASTRQQETIASAVLLAAAAAAAADSSHSFPTTLQMGNTPGYPAGMYPPSHTLSSSTSRDAPNSCPVNAQLASISLYPSCLPSSKSTIVANNAAAWPEVYSSHVPAAMSQLGLQQQAPVLDHTSCQPSLGAAYPPLPAGSVHVQVRDGSLNPTKGADEPAYQQHNDSLAVPCCAINQSVTPGNRQPAPHGTQSGVKRRSLGVAEPDCEQPGCVPRSEPTRQHVRCTALLKAGAHKLLGAGAGAAGRAGGSAGAGCEGVPDAAVYLAANRDLRRVKRRLSEDAAWGTLGTQPSANSSSSVSSLAAYAPPV